MGSEMLMNQFRRFALSVIPDLRVRVGPRSTVHGISFLGRHAEKMVDALYSGAPVALERKMAIAMDILAHRQKTVL
jgi:hypothetical protein